MSFDHENKIKIWALDKTYFDEQIPSIVKSTAIAVEDLENQFNKWANPLFYLQQVGDGSQSAITHVVKIKTIYENMIDLRDLLIYYSSGNHYADSVKDSFKSRLGEIEDFRDKPKRYAEILDRIADFALNLERSYPGVLSLSLKNEDEKGIYRIRENWQIIRHEILSLDSANMDLSQHPGFKWCEKRIEEIVNVRNRVQSLLELINQIAKLDQSLGDSMEEFSISKFEDPDQFDSSLLTVFEKKIKNEPHTHWMNWALDLVNELKNVDSNNFTGWKGRVKLGEFTGCRNVETYFEHEIRRIKKVIEAISDSSKLTFDHDAMQLVDYQERAEFSDGLALMFKELGIAYIPKDNSEDKLSSVFEEEEQEFKNVSAQLLAFLKGFASWENLYNFSNEDNYQDKLLGGILLLETGILPNIIKLVQIMSDIDESTPDSSRFYLDKVEKLLSNKEKPQKVLSEYMEMLNRLIAKEAEWRIALSDVEVKKTDWFAYLQKPRIFKIFKKNEGHVKREMLRESFKTAYKIAPKNEQIIQQIKDFTFFEVLDA